jgi:hypothetical protein
MKRSRVPMFLAMALCALLLGACGSSSSSSTSNSTSTPASSSSTPSTSSTSTGTSTSPGIKAAVEQCKSIIASQTKLTKGAKGKLEAACSEAAKGNTAAVKKAAKEVCEEVINTSSLPSAAKEQAKATCNK